MVHEAIPRARPVVAQQAATLVAASAAMFLLGAIYAYGVLLPALMAAFGWPRATAALPHAVLLFTYAVGMALGGALQDRTSPTLGVIGGGLLFGGGLLLASEASGLPGLIGGYGVMAGIGFGFCYVACVTAAMRSFPGRRGLAAGAVVGAFGLGAFVWAPLAQSGLPTVGWSGVMRGFGGLCFVALPLLGLVIRAPHPAHTAHAHRGLSLGGALRTPLFWTLFAAYTVVTAVGLLLLAHLVSFAMSVGVTPATAAWLLSASAAGSGLGRFAMGWLSDRVGRLPCLIGASVAEGAFLIALSAVTGLPALLLLAFATGVAFGTWLSLYGPTATDLFGLRAAGAVYGALYLSYGIGGLLGPTLGGAAADAGGYRSVLLTAAIASIFGAVLFIIAAQLTSEPYTHPPALEEEIPLEN